MRRLVPVRPPNWFQFTQFLTWGWGRGPTYFSVYHDWLPSYVVWRHSVSDMCARDMQDMLMMVTDNDACQIWVMPEKQAMRALPFLLYFCWSTSTSVHMTLQKASNTPGSSSLPSRWEDLNHLLIVSMRLLPGYLGIPKRGMSLKHLQDFYRFKAYGPGRKMTLETSLS